MAQRTFEIKHPSELNSLLSSRLFRTRGRGAIRLSSDLAHPERERWESDINRFYYACGCDSAAKGLMVMLVAGLALTVAAYSMGAMSFGHAVGFTIGCAVAGAVLGRLYGTSRARRRLTRVVHIVQANWPTKDEHERPLILCG